MCSVCSDWCVVWYFGCFVVVCEFCFLYCNNVNVMCVDKLCEFCDFILYAIYVYLEYLECSVFVFVWCLCCVCCVVSVVLCVLLCCVWV